MMTIERFAALIEAYGADRRRWPEAERRAALALLAADARARTLLADAHDLDWVLDADPAPAVSPALRARVLAGAPTPRQAARWALAAWARLWAPRAGLAAAGLAGVMFGAVLGGAADFGADTGADRGAQALLAEADPYDELAVAEGEAS